MTDPIEALVLFTIGWAAGVLTFLAAHMLGKRPSRQSNVFPLDRNVRGFEIPKSWHDKNSKHDEIPF